MRRRTAFILAPLSVLILAHPEDGIASETVDVNPSATRLAYPAEEGFYYILYLDDDVITISKALNMSTEASVEDQKRPA